MRADKRCMHTQDEDEIEDELNDLMLDDDPIETPAAATPFLPDVPQQVCLQSVVTAHISFNQHRADSRFTNNHIQFGTQQARHLPVK